MHEAVKQYTELHTTTKYYIGQMLSISFTTEHSCVSSLTFMVLGSPPPAKLKLPEKSRNLMMGEVRGMLFGYTRIL